MVNVGHSSLQAGLQPKSVGLVWRSVAAWRSPAFVRWTTCTAPLNRLCPCYGAIEIVEVIIIISDKEKDDRDDDDDDDELWMNALLT